METFYYVGAVVTAVIILGTMNILVSVHLTENRWMAPLFGGLIGFFGSGVIGSLLGWW